MFTPLITAAAGFAAATVIWPRVLRRNMTDGYTPPDKIAGYDWAKALTAQGKRLPDFVIGPLEDPYLLRWWVIPRNGIFNIYRHHIRRDDDHRALHDHPWPSVSIVTRGILVEHLDGRSRRLRRFIPYPRGSKTRHRLEVYSRRGTSDRPANTRTIFITGLRGRDWGFWCEGERFVPWQDFTKPGSAGEMGRGCQ